ncbi:MAG: class I SAM-dependent methyltransferase [Acidobacteriota bacterium]
MNRSIEAYDEPDRIASYDSDMEVMHPNRSRMARVALEILPFDRQQPLVALDLGSGTGYFTHRFLEEFPKGRVICVDGAQAMIDLAKVRLGTLVSRADFRLGDFRGLGDLLRPDETGFLAFSSYALHHLDPAEKRHVLERVRTFLRPGGWFLNADLIAADDQLLENQIQRLRVDGIVRRAAGKDPRFIDADSTRQFLRHIETRDGDQPVSVLRDLRILEEAGFHHPSVLWLEYREAVTAARIED